MDQKQVHMDYQLVEVLDMYINRADAHDFSDSYIQSANYNGVPMTDEQLDELNADGSFVYEQILKRVY